MDVLISARHEDFDPDIKEYAERKLERMSRYFKGTRSLEVILDGDHVQKSVELKAHLAKGAPIVVVVRHEDALTAIDIAGGKLERLLHRLKEKLEDRRHGRGHGAAPHVPIAAPDSEDLGDAIPDLNG